MNDKPLVPYTDARGIDRVGRIAAITDFGGSDIRYRMIREDGTVDMVPGKNVK